MSRILPSEELAIPEYVALVDSTVPSNLLQRLEQTPSLSNIRLIQAAAPSECRATLQALINKIHKL